jgi:hypothetical protein
MFAGTAFGSRQMLVSSGVVKLAARALFVTPDNIPRHTSERTTFRMIILMARPRFAAAERAGEVRRHAAEIQVVLGLGTRSVARRIGISLAPS